MVRLPFQLTRQGALTSPEDPTEKRGWRGDRSRFLHPLCLYNNGATFTLNGIVLAVGQTTSVVPRSAGQHAPAVTQRVVTLRKRPSPVGCRKWSCRKSVLVHDTAEAISTLDTSLVDARTVVSERDRLVLGWPLQPVLRRVGAPGRTRTCDPRLQRNRDVAPTARSRSSDQFGTRHAKVAGSSVLPVPLYRATAG